MFTQSFGNYVSEGDKITCEIDGFTLTATIYNDDDSSAPWERDDGHGPVSDWTSRDEKSGERLLIQDGSSKRFYDFAVAVKLARQEGWGAGPDVDGETPCQKADVLLTSTFAHTLWGTEANYPGSDNSYLTEVANEHIDEALDAARAKLRELTA